MLSNISAALIYWGISASFFAWGNNWGTAILAAYALGSLLPCESSEAGGGIHTNFLIILEFALMILVAAIGAVAIGFVVTPRELFGIHLGIVSCIVVLAIHAIIVLRPE